MPTLVTLEIKRTVYVIIPDGHPADARQLVADRDGDDIETITVVHRRNVSLKDAADNHDAARLNDEGTGLTVDEVDWIEGQQ